MNADDDAPKNVRLARQAIRELFDDIRLAQGCSVPTGFMARENEKKSAKLLWSDFLRNASHQVCSVTTTHDVSLETLMASIKDGFPVPDPRDDDADKVLCTRRCRFVGAASAATCDADPDSIVRICSPDPDPMGHCAYTLSFDATELGEQIRVFRASGRARMPNLALRNKELNPELLRVELDKDTVDALEWQVQLARERAVLRQTEISSTDHYA